MTEALPPPPGPISPESPAVSRHGYWGPLPGESPKLYEAIGAPALQRIILDRMPENLRGNFNMHAGQDPGRDVEPGTPLPPVDLTRQERLENFVAFTKRNEIIHMIGLTAGGLMWESCSTLPNGETRWWTIAAASILGVITLVGNVPPIIVQRYNRLRAYRLLDKMSAASAPLSD